MLDKILNIVKSPLVGLVGKPLVNLVGRLVGKKVAKGIVDAANPGEPEKNLAFLEPVYKWIEDFGALISRYAHKYADKVGLGGVYESAIEPQVEAFSTNADSRFRKGLDRDD